MPLVNPVDITDEKVKEVVNFFNETLGWQSIFGLFLIVIGVILVNSFKFF